MIPAYARQSPISAQSYAPNSGFPAARTSDTKIPWSSTVAVSWVEALSVRRTLIESDESSVQADQRLSPDAAAPTRPTGEPSLLANTYWPIQPPFFRGCQSIAAAVYVSTTWRRPRTSTGAAPGASSLGGNPAFVTDRARSLPLRSVVTRRRNVSAVGRRTA